MTPPMGAYEAFYASALQHPILLWLAAGSALAFCLARRGLAAETRLYCAALGVLSLLDAWLTSEPVFGIGPLPHALRSAVPLFFVLAGDARFLLIVAAATPTGGLRFAPGPVAQTLFLTLLVPLASQVALALLPESVAGPRTLYLVYELGFVLLTLALLRWHPKAIALPWVRNVGRFVILYYSLWALADALILFGGWDVGFAVRVVPNLLYYGGLIAAVGWLAPNRADPTAAA